MRLAAWMLAAAVFGGPSALPLTPREPSPGSVRVASPRLLARFAPASEPEGDSLRSRGDGPLTAEERARRDAVVQALLAAEAQATESPETAEAPLVAALRDFGDIAPLVADDAEAQQARAFAALALARTRLVLDRPGEADEALDEALVAMRGRPLPVDQFGPALVARHDERAATLAARPPASLLVRCTVPCRVLVDELAFDPAERTLPAGPHRVWIEALAPGEAVLRRALVLAPGEAVELAYAVQPPPEPEPAPAPAPAPVRRILPRWASVLGLAAGTSAVAAGGVLVGVDHRCPDLSDPRRVDCLRILNTDTGGFALLGVGAAAVITAAVILAIDEVRARRARDRR